jgi:hypothetical protein
MRSYVLLLVLLLLRGCPGNQNEVSPPPQPAATASPAQAEAAQVVTDPTCCDREATDALKQAWKDFTADGRYRLAVPKDMKWRDANTRAFVYSWGSLGYDKHASAYYHLAAIVIDTTRNDPNRFSVVIFSSPRKGNGGYRPYWLLQGRDLSDSNFAGFSGYLDLVSGEDDGPKGCAIRWNPKINTYVCRSS